MSNIVFYFIAATAFAVIATVCGREWSLDSRRENEHSGFVKLFHSHKVGIAYGDMI